jgi:hypothetical protein
MKQAIAGVAVPADKEVTIMTVWPSVAAMSLGGLPLGLMLGRLFALDAGFYIFTLGNLFCLLSIPLAIVLYFKRIGPFVGRRYRLTNRRLIVERGLTSKEEKAIALDHFDSVEIRVRPGQSWYDAGDLVFRQGTVERFLLEGVSRPAAFREVCLKARNGFVGVQKVMQREAAVA